MVDQVLSDNLINLLSCSQHFDYLTAHEDHSSYLVNFKVIITTQPCLLKTTPVASC